MKEIKNNVTNFYVMLKEGEIEDDPDFEYDWCFGVWRDEKIIWPFQDL